MQTSENTEIIDEALLEVQRELKLLGKDKGVSVERGGKEISSRYATSALIYEACHDLLVKHGITLWQGGEQGEKGGERLLTVLSKGGQRLVSSFPIIAREGAQNFGGGLAFAKRWGLQAAVGIFTSDDIDAKRGDGYEPSGKAAKRGAPPAGIAEALAAIRGARDVGAVDGEARRARGAFPTGDAAGAVEKAISDWFVATLDAAADEQAVLLLRTACNTVKPRGSEVRSAVQRAEQRVKGGPS